MIVFYQYFFFFLVTEAVRPPSNCYYYCAYDGEVYCCGDTSQPSEYSTYGQKPFAMSVKFSDTSKRKDGVSPLSKKTSDDTVRPLQNFLRLPLHLLHRPPATASINSIPTDLPDSEPFSKVSLTKPDSASSPAEENTSDEGEPSSLFSPLSSFLSFMNFSAFDFSNVTLPPMEFLSLFSGPQTTISTPINTTDTMHSSNSSSNSSEPVLQERRGIDEASHQKRHVSGGISSQHSFHKFSHDKLILMDDLPRGTVISLHSTSSQPSGEHIALGDQSGITHLELPFAIKSMSHKPPLSSVSHQNIHSGIQHPVSTLNVVKPQIHSNPAFISSAEQISRPFTPYPPGSVYAPVEPPVLKSNQPHLSYSPLPHEPHSYDMVPPSYDMLPPPPLQGHPGQDKAELSKPDIDIKELESALKSMLCKCERDSEDKIKDDCDCDGPEEVVLVFPPKPLKPYIFVPIKTIPDKSPETSLPPHIRTLNINSDNTRSVNEQILDKSSAVSEEDLGKIGDDPHSVEEKPAQEINLSDEDLGIPSNIAKPASQHGLIKSVQQNDAKPTSANEEILLPGDHIPSPSIAKESFVEPVYHHPVLQPVYHQPIPVVRQYIPVSKPIYKSKKRPYSFGYKFVEPFLKLLKAPFKKAIEVFTKPEDEPPYVYIETNPYGYATPDIHQQDYQFHAPVQVPVQLVSPYPEHIQYEPAQQLYQTPIQQTNGVQGIPQIHPETTQQDYLYLEMLQQLHEIQKIRQQEYKLPVPLEDVDELYNKPGDTYFDQRPLIQSYGLPLLSDTRPDEEHSKSVPQILPVTGIENVASVPSLHPVSANIPSLSPQIFSFLRQQNPGIISGAVSVEHDSNEEEDFIPVITSSEVSTEDTFIEPESLEVDTHEGAPIDLDSIKFISEDSLPDDIPGLSQKDSVTTFFSNPIANIFVEDGFENDDDIFSSENQSQESILNADLLPNINVGSDSVSPPLHHSLDQFQVIPPSFSIQSLPVSHISASSNGNSFSNQNFHSTHGLSSFMRPQNNIPSLTSLHNTGISLLSTSPQQSNSFSNPVSSTLQQISPNTFAHLNTFSASDNHAKNGLLSTRPQVELSDLKTFPHQSSNIAAPSSPGVALPGILPLRHQSGLSDSHTSPHIHTSVETSHSVDIGPSPNSPGGQKLTLADLLATSSLSSLQKSLSSPHPSHVTFSNRQSPLPNFSESSSSSSES